MLHIYIHDISSLRVNDLTLILLTWRKWWTPNNASKWQIGFNSAFKGLNRIHIEGNKNNVLLQISKWSERINLRTIRRGTRNTKCTVDMTVDMTALVLSWGYFNVCGPTNQQSRLTNGCGAGTNEPGWMPPCSPSILYKNISLQPPLCSLIGWFWCDHYVIRLPICFINVLWEAIQLFLTVKDQVDSDLKWHLSVEREETDIDRALGVRSSKLHLHR